MRLIAITATVALIALGLAAWFAFKPRANGAFEINALGPDPAEIGRNEPAVTRLDDPDAPLGAPSEIDVADDDERVALVTETKPSAPDAIDHSLASAPFELIVVDERSNAALPRFLVQLTDVAGRKLHVVTDDRGQARSEPLALGKVTAVPLDHDQRRAEAPRITIDHIEKPSRPHVVSVASGPTYRLAFAPTAGPDPSTIQVRITLDNEDGNSATTSFEPVRAIDPYRREGEPVWVRFQALDETLTRGKRIEARSRDGLWSGFANVTVAVGEAVEPARIELDARGVLTGKVTSSGVPVEGAVVAARVAASVKEKSGYNTSTRTNAKGEYRIEFVRTLDLTIHVGSILHEAAERDAAVRGGETQVQDFDLVALPTVGRIAGTVVSETGAYEPRVDVTLLRSGQDRGDVPRLRTRVRWRTIEGRRVGDFEFGPVPKGKYRVDLARVDWFEWTPRRIDVEAPQEDIVVRIADRALVADFAFEVHDADNGFALKRAHIVLETIDGERQQWIDSGDVVLRAHPEDKRLRWRLDKTGYPSRIGDVKDFKVTTLVDGRRVRTAEINVQRGWSDVVRVQQTKTEKPIADVVVSIDGREAGRTDKFGQLRLSAREKPKSLTFALAGWRMEGGVDMRTPSQRNYRRFIEVRMRPTKKK